MTSGTTPVLDADAHWAVQHRGSHMQIIACAGSGKTEVVAQRVADLIAEGVDPAGIIAFTFTKRATEELKARISGAGSGGPAVPGAAVAVGRAARPGAGVPSPSEPEPAAPRNTRFFGVAVVSPVRYARDRTRPPQEVIQHLAAGGSAELEIGVEIAAHHSGGYPEDKIRNVTENARTLKFEYGFEDS